MIGLDTGCETVQSKDMQAQPGIDKPHRWLREPFRGGAAQGREAEKSFGSDDIESGRREQWNGPHHGTHTLGSRDRGLPGLCAARSPAQRVTAPRYRGAGTVEAPTRQLSLPTPPPVSSPNATVVEDIIARVNDQVIDRSDLMRRQMQLQQEAQQGKIPAAELPTCRRICCAR